jgi:ankyrin repeat protein
LLAESGASSNVANKLGCTPLHSAVFAGHVPLAELLLLRGADVHAQDRDGMTPLHWAVAERRFSLIEPLVNGK